MTDRDPALTSKPCGQYFVLGDDDRTPVDVGDQSDWLYWSDYRYIFRRVQETKLGDYIISTVFSGRAIHGPDKLFETMIYEDEAGIVLADQKPELAIWYCATWDEAEYQHEQAIVWLNEQMASAALETSD